MKKCRSATRLFVGRSDSPSSERVCSCAARQLGVCKMLQIAIAASYRTVGNLSPRTKTIFLEDISGNATKNLILKH